MTTIRLRPYTNEGLENIEITINILAIVLFSLDLIMIVKLFIISNKFFKFILKDGTCERYVLLYFLCLTTTIMLLRSFYRNIEKNAFDLYFFEYNKSDKDSKTKDNKESNTLTTS